MRLRSLLALVSLPAFCGHAAACSNETTIITSAPAKKDGGTLEDPNASPEEDGGVAAPEGGDGKEAGVVAGPFVEAPHRPFPEIPANGHEVLSPMKLVSIVSAGDTLADDLLDFGDALVASNWWKAVGADYGLTTSTHVRIHSSEAITSNPTQSGMDAYIGRAISGHPEAADNGHAMYMLYLPDGIVDSGNANCASHGGYHTIGQSGRVWGVAMRCATTGTGLSRLELLTVFASHEIIEAATDPNPGNGFTLGPIQTTQSSPWSSTQGEVGDMCVQTTVGEGSWTYQRSWSNAAAAAGGDPCVPPVKTPYFSVSVPQDWYAIPHGGSIDIPVTGWSKARVGDWVLETQQYAGSGTFTPALTSPTSMTAQGTTLPTINNGRQATLKVRAPAQSGAYAVIWILSIPPFASQDPYHFWPVGVYTQ